MTEPFDCSLAVVAEEVRKLAEDPNPPQARSDDGSETVERTRAAFERIDVAVSDIAQRVEEIATAAQQVAGDTQKMHESIGNVAAVAEESSASS